MLLFFSPTSKMATQKWPRPTHIRHAIVFPIPVRVRKTCESGSSEFCWKKKKKRQAQAQRRTFPDDDEWYCASATEDARTMFLLRRRCESEGGESNRVVYMDQSRDMQIHQSERRKNGDMFCGEPLPLGKRGKGMERDTPKSHKNCCWNNFNKHSP